MTRACRCQHLERDHRRSKGGHGSERGECRECVFCERYRDASTERTAKLREIADAAFRKFEAHFKSTGEMRPFLGMGRIEFGWGLTPLPDNIDMSSGHHKDLLFSRARWLAEQAHADVVIFISDAWMGRSLHRGAWTKEQEDKFRGKGVEELAEAGLVTKAECIIINVQTRDGWMLVCRFYERGRSGPIYGAQTQAEGGPDEFEGRQKMFGKPPADYSWHDLAGRTKRATSE
jgi:hypothetical protein